MKVPKAIFLTILYFISLELIGLWILLIPDVIEYLGLIKSSHLINSVVSLIFLLLIFKIIKRTDLLKFNKVDPKYYLSAIILGIGFVFFQSILNIFYHLKISSDLFDFDFTLDRLTNLNALATIFVVPITEELFFRNYLQVELTKNYKVFKAIIFSSLLFAFIHIPFVSLIYESINFNLHQAYITFFGGLISGVLLYKSKSIVPSIIFHIFWNLASYVF